MKHTLSSIAEGSKNSLLKTWKILSLSLILVAGCDGNKSALTITGSSTMAPMIAGMAEIFEQHSGQRVDVQSGGSGRGINDTLGGQADIGMSSRALMPQELSAGLVAHLVAHDGIAVIVHARNPVAELDETQIRSIFRGEVKNWLQLAEFNQPVTVVNKAEGRSTLTLFLKFFDLEHREVAPDLVAGENQQVILFVAGNPGSIGYVSIGAAQEAEANGEKIRLLPLDGVEASIAAVQRNRYPLRRELNLVTLGPPGPLANSFIEMVQSKPLHTAIEGHHFVPVSP